MTILNGSTVLAADLNAMLTASLQMLVDDNGQLPVGAQMNVFFPNLTASARFTFVAPCDLLVEVAAVQAADMTAASTTTVTLLGDVVDGIATGPVANWPLTIEGTTGAGVTALPRLLNDNTKTNVSFNFATTARPFRVYPKGSTITMTVSTTSVATPNTVQVCLVVREFWNRE